MSATATSATIDAALKPQPWWQVRLPGTLEREFREDMLDRRITHVLRSGWLGLLIHDSFLLVDWLMAGDVFWFSVMVRMLVITPGGILMLVMLHRHSDWIRRKKALLVNDWIIYVSGWAAALGLALILLKSHSPLAMYYHAGFLVVMIYGTLVQQLSVKSAAGFILGILLIDFFCAAHGQEMPTPIRIAMMELLTVCGSFCMVAVVTVERARRRRYLLMRRENNLSESLLTVNMQLQELSRSDVLTGVANRRHLHEYIQQVWDRAMADGSPISVLMIDVDHFKRYNDLYGHPAGDECLRQVAACMRKSLRNAGDFVARYGGEEFVAVLPGAPMIMAEQAAERVRQSIEALSMRHEDSTTSPVVTVSIGVATAIPGTLGMNPDKLISNADRALYDAKRGARNRVCIFKI